MKLVLQNSSIELNYVHSREFSVDIPPGGQRPVEIPLTSGQNSLCNFGLSEGVNQNIHIFIGSENANNLIGSVEKGAKECIVTPTSPVTSILIRNWSSQDISTITVKP